MKFRAIFLLFPLFGWANIMVTTAIDTPIGTTPTVGSLRYAMARGTYMNGSIIDCSMIAGQTITLSGALPGIFLNGSLTITGGTGQPVIINGGGPGLNYQAFSIGGGNLTLSNFVIQNCTSKGGDGGAGDQGGGGGAGGGGGLYVHNGANAVLSHVNFSSNQAAGGIGGAGLSPTFSASGGGGGGYSGGASDFPQSQQGSGGGGGNNEGGMGGAGGNPGMPGYDYGGAGGAGGGTAAEPGGNVLNGITHSISFVGGTGLANNGGGGGAGSGGIGLNANSAGGGMGGDGVGIDNGFGSGGGGGGGFSVNKNGGMTIGTGGGGGAGFMSASGGAGGTYGGGGGGGEVIGGNGGFGAGGGGGGSIAGTSPLFVGGGGSGGMGVGGGGGGGAGMGGAIFVHHGGSVTIGDGFAPSMNSIIGGTGGAGTPMGNPGGFFGKDIFLRSGGTLVFINTTALPIINAIESDNPAVITASLGGLVMQGTGTLILSSNTYTSGLLSAGTTIHSGTVQIVSDGSLGQTPTASQPTLNSLAIGNGTLQLAPSISPILSSRLVTLFGAATIDTQASPNVLALAGVITGGGSLTKIGTGTLVLAPGGFTPLPNTYSGGTTINGGILAIAADTSLGIPTSTLTIGPGTLAVGGTFTSSRPITLTSTVSTIAVVPFFSPAFTGTINGPGTLILTTASVGITVTVTLLGNNSYSGGTIVEPWTDVVGHSKSLQGNILDSMNAAVIFDQTFNGTYAGSITGSGSIVIQGSGNLDMTGTSSAFAGPVSVLSPATLTVDGTLGALSVSIAQGAALDGAGLVIAPVLNSGQIKPGDAKGNTLQITGTVTFTGTSSSMYTSFTPTSTTLLAINGPVFLNGMLILNPAPGFYGFSRVYTVLTASSLNATQFSSASSVSSNFRFLFIYNSNNVQVVLQQIEPFLGFPFCNENIASVGNNLDALNAIDGGLIVSNPALVNAIDALGNPSNSAICNALDRMHPAAYSGTVETQVEVGCQIASLFQRKRSCDCSGVGRSWAEPFANWLEVSNHGEEVGFESITKGIAFGFENEPTHYFSVGLGGVWKQSDLDWKERRGKATIEGGYGVIYTDYWIDDSAINASLLIGGDHYKVHRLIEYPGTPNIHQETEGSYLGLEGIAHLGTAYYFGGCTGAIFPYGTFDYLFFQQPAFTETGSSAFALQIASNNSQTLRTEFGFGLRWQDNNSSNSFNIAPEFAFGWASEYPIVRNKYISKFVGQPVPFSVVGWDHTWQLFLVRAGLGLVFHCLTISGDYVMERSIGGDNSFFSQRCNVSLDYRW